MKKLFYTIVISFFILITNVNALDFEPMSKNILLYNLKDNKIIYEQNINKDTRIASLTKVVSALVALEHIPDLNDKVTLTDEVFTGLEEADASVAGFKDGEIVTYKDLLYGALLPSGADATRALAINLFGNEKKFVNKMNELVNKLNLKNIYFTNTSGLDEDNQKATLSDFLSIVLYALKNDKFVDIFNTRKYVTYSGRLNLNSTLNYYQNKYDLDTSIIIGGKTGYTDLAGLCLVSYAKNDDTELLLITTEAPVINDRYPYNVTDALSFYNYYFENYSYKNIVSDGKKITTIPTKYSKNKKADLIYKGKEFKYYLINGYEDSELSYEFQLDDYVNFATNVNTSVGKFTISHNNEEIFTGDLYLKEKVDFSIILFIIENKNTVVFSAVLILGFIVYNKKLKGHKI